MWRAGRVCCVRPASDSCRYPHPASLRTYVLAPTKLIWSGDRLSLLGVAEGHMGIGSNASEEQQPARAAAL